MLNWLKVREVIERALQEDVGSGDVTTAAVLDGDEAGTARAVAREDLVVAGIDVFRAVFSTLDGDAFFDGGRCDGERISGGDVIERVSGNLSALLTAERTALNFLQRMCGIATLTRRYVDAVEGTKAKILDTRKTVPGLREFDKYAVAVGGGVNHRFGLYGGVMIKDNHIAAASGIERAVERVRGRVPVTVKIEVETATLDDVDAALRAGVDIIMLDNMDIATMRTAVERIEGRVLVEASGNVTLERVRDIALTGVDFISVGELTHSPRASDISLIMEQA